MSVQMLSAHLNKNINLYQIINKLPVNMLQIKQQQLLFVYLTISICMTQLLHLTAAQSTYSIFAPNTLRPNSAYHVAVSIHKAQTPATIKLGIISSNYSDVKLVEVRPYSSELVHFMIPDLKPDRYRLTAEGIYGVTFINETQLHFDARQFTVLVQTDKAIYKPGDLVHYRVLVLNEHLKPVKIYGQLHIQILDGGQNIIQNFQNVRLLNSVFSNELQLSDYPKMGEWTIDVNVNGYKYVKNFEVMEYILPKYQVDIITERHVIYGDGKLRATVKAHYAFGKPIIGEATLSIYPIFFGALQPFVNDLITRKVAHIDGEAYFELDISNELRLKEDYEHEYRLDALVEERSTGSVQNYSTIITVHLHPYKVDTLKIPAYYIPGVPFEVTVKVSRTDGAMLKNFPTDITAYLTNVYGSSEMYNRTNYALNIYGEVKMKFTVPVGDTDEYHSVITDYGGIITDVGRVPRKHLHSKNYITAKLINDKAIVNQDISIAVRSNEPMSYFIYQIVARGDIILSRAVDVPETTYHVFKFTSNFAMAPRAKLLVYMVVQGEFVYDEQIITFDESLLNTIQVETPVRAPPGQEIDINISTKPHSLVGLMLVDQNVPKVQNDNDLSYDGLMNALKNYELQDINTPLGSPGRLSGVITMTNTAYFVEQVPETIPLLERAALTNYEDEDKQTIIRKTDIGPAHKIEVNTLAPGKGRYAFSYTPKPFWHNPRIHLMRNPADTWLFTNLTVGLDGRRMLQRRIPSDITSWTISAFSLDPVTGLGLTIPKKSMQSYKDFYINTELPYSIRKGETIALSFVVFNNKQSDLDAIVTLHNTAQDFDFPDLNNKAEATPKIELYSRRTVRVLAESSKTVSFIVTPKRVGAITVKAVVSSQLAGDTVEKTLLVEYAGATETVNRGIYFDLSASTQKQEIVPIKVPRNAIPESTKIEVSATGDLVGSFVDMVAQLIQLPTGCGEQTMVNFMPNIMVLKYFDKIQRLTPMVAERSKKLLELGYQRLLYYRHTNGGFSAFGLSERNASTWLTAYVASAFRQASAYVQIDERTVQQALEFVIARQNADGSFEERGDIFEDFGDAGLSLSAFATLSLLENSNLYPQYRNNINKALDYLTRGLDSTTDLHALAIGTYVLSRARHAARGAFMQRLDAMAVHENGKKWWNKTAPAAEFGSPWYNSSRTVNIEITAYATLALLENQLLGDTLKIIPWLLDQRNSLGGFIGSQDTVVGLQALLAFAESFNSQTNNIQVGFKYGQGAQTLLNVNAETAYSKQIVELPNSLKNVSISATGNGRALVQVTYKYNTNVTSAWPRFVLDPHVNRYSHADYLYLSVCASFVPVQNGRNQSNMAVMEIHLPSGFVVDNDLLPTLESNERIKKVETARKNTLVYIYFDYLEKRELCPTLHAHKVFKVTNHQLVPVIMYDYYDNAKRARQFYRAPKSSVCDICEYANCGTLCEKAEKRAGGATDSSSNNGSARSASSPQCQMNLLLAGILLFFLLIRTLK